MDLTDDLEKIREGWDACRPIQSRAVAMRDHAQAGNHDRAEELAIEIEALQYAETQADADKLAKCFGRDPEPIKEPTYPGREEWRISLTLWASILLRGYKVRRSFHPDCGCTEAEALSEAYRVYFPEQHGFSITTQNIVPMYPAERRVAA